MMRRTGIVLNVMLWAAAAAADESPADRKLPANPFTTVRVERCAGNPLITFDSSETLGRNINGPSVIRVPDWIEEPLGTYYMYFAHHQGTFIRLAYADRLEGPWSIYEPGTLHLEQATAFKGHIASPDLHIDHEKRELIMYFHGPAKDRDGQWSGVATSTDGIHFTPSEAILGHFYFRVFEWNGMFYALAKDGNSGWGSLYRSEDGRTPFELRGQILAQARHMALQQVGSQLRIFYSRKGDAPERILLATLQLTDNWDEWTESEPIDILAPEAEYEGIAYPNAPSDYGSAIEVRQLRDPCIFEEDGRTYLFYSYAGEMGIAMAEVWID